MLCLMSAILMATTGTSFTDRVLVTMEVNSTHPPSPGKFIYNVSGGYQLIPVHFAVGQDGQIYIPEVTGTYELRVHKFSGTGKFFQTLDLEGPRLDYILGIEVLSNGDLIVQTTAPTGWVSVMRRYSKSGELQFCFGKEGEIRLNEVPDTPKETQAARLSGIPKLFESSQDAIVELPDNEILVIKHIGNDVEVSAHLGAKGRAKSTNPTSQNQRELALAGATKKQQLIKSLFGRDGGLSNIDNLKSTTCANGKVYYNVVTPQRLEIHEVTIEK